MNSVLLHIVESQTWWMKPPHHTHCWWCSKMSYMPCATPTGIVRSASDGLFLSPNFTVQVFLTCLPIIESPHWWRWGLTGAYQYSRKTVWMTNIFIFPLLRCWRRGHWGVGRVVRVLQLPVHRCQVSSYQQYRIICTIKERIVVGTKHVHDPATPRYYREVLPGEIVQISRHGVKSLSVVRRPEGDLPAFCIFEYVYFARPDSIFEG